MDPNEEKKIVNKEEEKKVKEKTTSTEVKCDYDQLLWLVP